MVNIKYIYIILYLKCDFLFHTFDLENQNILMSFTYHF